MIGNSPLPSSTAEEDENFQVSSDNLEAELRSTRLKEAVRHGGGNTIVAKRAGISIGTLNNYIAGRDMKTSFMVALAHACGVNIAWLAAGEGPMVGESQKTADPGVHVPAASAFATLDLDALSAALETAETFFARTPGGSSAEDRAKIIVHMYDLVVKERAIRAAAEPTKHVDAQRIRSRLPDKSE